MGRREGGMCDMRSARHYDRDVESDNGVGADDYARNGAHMSQKL